MTWTVEDKTCVITGASAGIGLETARVLAKRGARVVMVCRNREKSEALRAQLSLGARHETALIVADLSIRTGVRNAAREVLASYERVEVLINNAGAIFSDRMLTTDGLERTFALNHLAYFYFTQLLLDRLKTSAPARIINVASRAHRKGHADFENLQGEKSWSGPGAYRRSKLLNILFTYELARRLQGSDVTANCLHPGVIASEFGFSARGAVRMFFSLARPLLSTTEQGAKTTIRLACAPELSGVTGKYFAAEQQEESSPESHDRAKAARLWDVSDAFIRAS